MARSNALNEFEIALGEINDLGQANPTPVGAAPANPNLTRVVGRACVVLLSSHFERYIYSVNEELVTFLRDQEIPGNQLPELLRLLHSKDVISDLEQTQWDNKKKKLEEFLKTDGWLWIDGLIGDLEHQRFLSWMKAPFPRSLIRYYRYWGINDIFSAITRNKHTRGALHLRIRELVDKRNNIAHGDFSAQATQRDVQLYSKAAWTFCERADRAISRQISKLFGIEKPW